MDAAVATEGPSPAEDGFSMPPEWAPHAQTWMGWPDRPDNWRDGARPAQAAYARVAAAIAEFEPVTVCASPAQAEAARAALPEGVRVLEVPQDDAWFRDTGPTMVVRDGAADGSAAVAGVDWDFNAWGGLYASCSRDQEVARRILELEGLRRFKCPLVLEGGSIHVDGERTLLTTEECLLNPNRNPGLGREEVEAALRAMLGVTRVLWLPRGLVGDDDTDGHVDNFACFARPGVVLLAWTDDEADPQHAVSSQALALLEGSRDARGRALQVIKVPCPPNLFMTADEAAGVAAAPGTKPRAAGDRLAASYVNFYLCNGGLVMPAFGVPEADDRAQRVLEAAFPGRRVVAVQTREIVLGGGNIHCITQQQPAAATEAAGRGGG